ncbi:capsular exopolysaccharide family [Chloroherpeton thalassium ATCC 35110]|uniref:non-specific protein-tyrosine kinase n=1 Tax=Chloroherpeton thalassium (strain ATCC 35110 / GB-78) TaxID=517418 RepID=B3QVI2_CHLT3|nr:polysaccharide biosynthesis tyrosine autokinase [Chloroherpeton thalassium]ACF14582.1 capsular exopolysaccharide family [Chloroherpeton thalassium ATCC 35110]
MSKDFLNGNQAVATNSGSNYPVFQRESDFLELEDDFDFKRIFSLLLRYKWLILSSVIFSTLISALAIYFSLPIYKSEGTMLVQESSGKLGRGAGSDLSNLLASTYGVGMGSTIANELFVLQSRKMSYKLAKVLLQERWQKGGELYPLLWEKYPDDSTIVSEDVLAQRIRKQLQVAQADKSADVINISFESPSPFEASRMVDLTMDTYSTLSTEQNRLMARSALEFLENEKQRVENNLRVTEEQLRDFMNQKGLIQIDAQTTDVIKILTDLESKSQEIKVQRVAIDAALQNYKQQLNSFKPGIAEQYTDAYGATLSRCQYRLAELETERLLILSRNPGLKQKEENSPELKKIQDEISVLRSEIKVITSKMLSDDQDQLSSILSATNGDIAAEILLTKRKLLELDIQRRQYDAQSAVLEQELEKKKLFFEKIPDNMIILARLKRNVDVNEKLYLTISERYAETALWEQTQFGLGRPIDYGYLPEAPIKPKKQIFLLVGFLFGLAGAVTFIYVKESLNTGIDGAEKLKKKQYPLLAVIPDMEEVIKESYDEEKYITVKGSKISTRLVSFLDVISPIAESFRRLQSNVIYSHPDEKLKLIVVTSPGKGEGKTTVISNFAVALAESGKKIILVDTDFRRPYVHKMFGLDQQPGLTETLFDGVPVEEVIMKSIVPNIDILTTGKRPSNPAAVNQSLKLRELLQSLKKKYDHVLVDTAPFGITTDAASIMKLTNGVILVVRFGQTSETELDQTVENLRQVNANIIGTVLSAFDYRKTSDHYYNSGYYKYSYKRYTDYHEEKEV